MGSETGNTHPTSTLKEPLHLKNTLVEYDVRGEMTISKDTQNYCKKISFDGVTRMLHLYTVFLFRLLYCRE